MQQSEELREVQKITAREELLKRHFSIQYAKALTDNVLLRLNTNYFRCRFFGFEQPVERGEHPPIFFSNHSGMAFPWDAVMLISMSFQYYQQQVEHGFRALIDKQLSRVRLMNPFMVEHLWQRAGGITATFKNFDAMMHMHEGHVLIYPEGVPGIGKGFDKRYKLQVFSTSFIKMALQYQVPLYPVSTINAEYVNPYMYSWKWLDRLVQKIGLPFLPVGWALPLLVLQPWIFYFSLPANLTYVRGEPIYPDELSTKPFDSLHENDFRRIANQVQEKLQQTLEQEVKKHGRRPLQLKKWWAEVRSSKDWIASFPFFWPFLFTEFNRQWEKEASKDKQSIQLGRGFRWLIKALFYNPIILCYYIPILGWIPIILKGKKRYKN